MADEISFIQVTLKAEKRIRLLPTILSQNCTFKCIFKLARQENLDPQKSHLYFLMPVCVT